MQQLEGILLDALERRKSIVEKLCFEGNYRCHECKESIKHYINLSDYLRVEHYEIPKEHKLFYNHLKYKRVKEK